MTATYAVFRNMRPNRQKGYKSCPFDLAFSSLDKVLKCIQNDYKDFFKNLYVFENFEKHKVIKNPVYNFTFPHEKIYKNDKTSIKFFKKRYEQRIANFDRYCKQAEHITFQWSPDINRAFVPAGIYKMIESAISEKYPELSFHAEIISTNVSNQQLKKILVDPLGLEPRLKAL